MLIQLICNVKSMEEAMMELKYDARRAPLGKLTKDQIRAGYTALNKISSIVSSLNDNDPAANTSTSKSGKREKRKSGNASVKRKLEGDLLIACNEFYTRIPHDFG